MERPTVVEVDGGPATASWHSVWQSKLALTGTVTNPPMLIRLTTQIALSLAAANPSSGSLTPSIRLSYISARCHACSNGDALVQEARPIPRSIPRPIPAGLAWVCHGCRRVSG